MEDSARFCVLLSQIARHFSESREKKKRKKEKEKHTLWSETSERNPCVALVSFAPPHLDAEMCFFCISVF